MITAWFRRRGQVSRAAELIRERNAAQPDAADELRGELNKAERERDDLVAALARGGVKPEAVVSAISERERRVDDLRRELASLESAPVLDELSDKRLERQPAERAAHWREVLARDPPSARHALRALLAGPIWFVPQGNSYQLRGSTRLGSLFPETRVELASPRLRELIPRLAVMTLLELG